MTPTDRTIGEVSQLRIGRRTIEAWLAADLLRAADKGATRRRGVA
jgi:hypothetical protein